MMPPAATRLGRVKKLARAGVWIATMVELALMSDSTGWRRSRAPGAARRSAATCCRRHGWR